MGDDSTTLYVGGLHPDTTDNNLFDAFEKYGNVLAVTIVRNRENGEPRKIALVQFETKSGLDKAYAAEGKAWPCTVELSRPTRDGGFRGGFRGGRDGDRGSHGDSYGSGDRCGHSSDRDGGDRYGGGDRGSFRERESFGDRDGGYGRRRSRSPIRGGRGGGDGGGRGFSPDGGHSGGDRGGRGSGGTGGGRGGFVHSRSFSHDGGWFGGDRGGGYDQEGGLIDGKGTVQVKVEADVAVQEKMGMVTDSIVAENKTNNRSGSVSRTQGSGADTSLVFVKDSLLRFQLTEVNSRTTLHFQLCNNGDFVQKVKVSRPVPPFFVDNLSLNIPPKNYVRVPVHFQPERMNASFGDFLTVTLENGDLLTKVHLFGKSSHLSVSEV